MTQTRSRFAAVSPEALALAPLGLLTACYLRRTGQTHLLADPAPQILAALVQGPADVAELTGRLALDYELEAEAGDGTVEASIGAALDELAALGLATRLDG